MQRWCVEVMECNEVLLRSWRSTQHSSRPLRLMANARGTPAVWLKRGSRAMNNAAAFRLNQIADFFGDVARFQVDQARVGTHGAHHSQYRLRTC